MLKLSIDAIEVIEAIERTGSMSAAAELLHKVPSTISYAVAKLEAQLATEIFDRSGTRPTLTAAGRELVREGRLLIAACADLECRLKRIAEGYETELRLVHDSLFPTTVFLDDLRAFQAQHCGTQLRITSEVMTGTWEALREGRADLVLAVGDKPAGSGFAAQLIGQIPFVFCVAPQHPLAQLQRPVEKADLVAHAAIVVADTARALPARSVGILSLQNRITVPNMVSKIQLQKAGLGYGFVPAAMISQELSSGELVELAVVEPRSDETVWLAWDTANPGKALAWWIHQCRKHLGGRIRALSAAPD